MSTPDNQTPSTPSSNDVNVTPPSDAVPAPKPSLSLKPVAPAAVAPAVAAATPDPVAAAAAPKPKLNLSTAPRSTANDLNAASAQKIPDRKYAAVAEDDDQPSIAVTLIAGIAAAAAITFAVLLFLKTK